MVQKGEIAHLRVGLFCARFFRRTLLWKNVCRQRFGGSKDSHKDHSVPKLKEFDPETSGSLFPVDSSRLSTFSTCLYFAIVNHHVAIVPPNTQMQKATLMLTNPYCRPTSSHRPPLIWSPLSPHLRQILQELKRRMADQSMPAMPSKVKFVDGTAVVLGCFRAK